jgi:hypothetical protein
MKTIQIKIFIQDDKDPGVQEIKLEKTGPSDEIEVLTSGISTIFLKSKDALGIANKQVRRVVSIGKIKRK